MSYRERRLMESLREFIAALEAAGADGEPGEMPAPALDEARLLLAELEDADAEERAEEDAAADDELDESIARSERLRTEPFERMHFSIDESGEEV